MATPSYGIGIAWGKPEFDCTPLWNADKHCYEGWESAENPITVSNTTADSVAIQVTLTFTALTGTNTAAVFALLEGEQMPDNCTISPGAVTFRLPKDVTGKSQATFNLTLSGSDLTSLSTQRSSIGSIKTEIAPWPAPSPVTRPAEEPTGPTGPVGPGQPEPLPAVPSPLPVQPIQPTPPLDTRPAEKPAEPSPPVPTAPGQPSPLPVQPEPPVASEQPPTVSEQPPATEVPPPATEVPPPAAVKPEPESKPDNLPPPGQNSNEETQTAPHIASDGSPQEEPQ